MVLRALQGLAALAAVVGSVIAVANYLDDEPSGVVRLGLINSDHPDYVEIIASGTHSIDVGGYRLCEHDSGEEKDSCCRIPPKAMVAPGSPLPVFFFSPKDPEKRAMAEEYRTQGKLVCDQFGLSAGELVVLYANDGTRLDEKKAN